MSHEVVVLGEPVGKGRPRFDTRRGRVYTPAKTESAENRVLEAWRMAGGPRVEGVVSLTVTAVFARPADHVRRDGTLTPKGQRAGAWHTSHPDGDNVLKLAGDALNGHAWEDDRLIAHAWVVKRWADPGEPAHLRLTFAPMPAGPEPVDRTREQAA